MNGLEKTQLQIERGTRPIVDNVDQLRLTYGFDKIEVLTPIVETRLRSGLLAARSMKVAYQSKWGQVIITLPMGYPKVPLVVEAGEQLRNSWDDITTRKEIDGSESYIGAKDVLALVLTELEKSFPRTEVSNECTKNASTIIVEDEENLGEFSIIFYYCRRCRCCLFDTTALHGHHGIGGANACSSKCTSLFLENIPPFIKSSGETQEGKINCPKCESRIGNWSWIGSQCSCGEWIVPAYQFTKSKLDERKG